MNRIFKLIYCLIFWTICMLPLVLFPFAKKNSNLEKKAESSMPAIISDGKINTKFSDEFNAYINENLPYRSELLTASNYIKSDILKAPTSTVITGKDGWIFYENTTSDYMNTNSLSDSELTSIVVTMSLIQENVENKGGSFLFVPVPNKNSVYSENMPGFYKKASENNLTRLYEMLEKSDVNYINLKETLIENKALGNLYHKKDTHWNYLGSMVAYNSITKGLNHNSKNYSLTDYTIKKDWVGDIEKLLHPASPAKDEQYYFNINYDSFTFDKPSIPGATPEEMLKIFCSDKEEKDTEIVSKNLNLNNGSKLYMVRDSFGRALLPLFIDNYEEATFVRTNCPYITTLKENTDMVYEIVERNLIKTMETCPFMYAPKRTISMSRDLNKTNFDSDKNLVITSDEGYAYRIYGTIDKDMLGLDGRIYVKLSNSTDSTVYEAFPIYEEKLLSDVKTNSSSGFSLMLDANSLKAGEYDISIISDGKESRFLSKIVVEN